jgi:hypothetical protein
VLSPAITSVRCSVDGKVEQTASLFDLLLQPVEVAFTPGDRSFLLT